MKILDKQIGLSEEDKKIVVRYLSPYVKLAAKNTAKKAVKSYSPKVALKAVRYVDDRLSDTDYRKTEFVAAKVKNILEKPEIKKQEAKNAKKQARIDRKENKKRDKLNRKYMFIDGEIGAGPVKIKVKKINPKNRRVKQIRKACVKSKLPLSLEVAASALINFGKKL